MNNGIRKKTWFQLHVRVLKNKLNSERTRVLL